MDALEEGQLLQDVSFASDQGYNTAYEWPGDDGYTGSGSDVPEPSTLRSSTSLRPGQPVFRLVVIRSSILAPKKKIAVVDAYPEVQIGRDVQPDGSTTPRVRLKEMEVSKLHATAYWDGARKEWNVVDMGSMHGTFLLQRSINPDSDDNGIRLSQSRMASIPRRLRHSDRLTLGSTTFEVHIHDNQRPCTECTVTAHEEIPLFPLPKKTAVKRTRDVAGIDLDMSPASSSFSGEKDPKKALTMLKRSLLTRHDGSRHASMSTVPVGASNEYVDRAARRRLLHPGSRPDTPGVSSASRAVSGRSELPSTFQEIQAPPSLVSQPPVPLPSTNMGHRLLIQQGWAPGNALGTPPESSEERTGLVDPLEVKSSQNRAGLGMKTSPVSREPTEYSGLGWKEKEKFKRFEELSRR
ncbi:hypothetical protein CPB84DRAFT_1779820 [Gymnopilus junonius]|uniref:Angiogenic factor with G patch and FHA domains 1 n=1 Tax=Gymnopilus junonius TaxID=109634 RepID=A0A9P5NQ12_GYMJU|nr:hypothetical protein CPB84DRAFT_1779820 [Gymnopilus junonius]